MFFQKSKKTFFGQKLAIRMKTIFFIDEWSKARIVEILVMISLEGDGMKNAYYLSTFFLRIRK